MISKPQPGRKYTVVKGDTLWDISAAAYGTPRKWETIYNANKTILRDPTIYPNTVVLIYPGEILNIPTDGSINTLMETVDKQSKDGDNLRFIISGKEINVISGRCVLCLDTLSDAASFSVDMDSAPQITPFGMEPCDVFIGDKKIFTGIVFSAETASDGKAETLNVSIFSKTRNIIDSCSEPPFAYRDNTLSQICNKILKPFSVKIIDSVGDSYKFKKATIDPEQKVGEFLLRLAKQRRVLLKSNENGDIEILRANTSGKPVLSIADNTETASSISFSFDCGERFSKYIAHGKRAKLGNIKGFSKDSLIRQYRVISDNAECVDSADIKNPADWMRRVAVCNSSKIGFSVNGFIGNNGIIRENNIVCIEKNTAFLDPGTNLLISSVEFEQSSDGKFTGIECVMPYAYTDGDFEEKWKTLGK